MFSRNYLRQLFFIATMMILCPCGFLTTFAAFGADKPEYLASFDPANGFKSAQSDLTEVFLQIAGSLEAYGSPEPYLRHMKAEHIRIEAKYQTQIGEKPRSFCPAYMDAAYFERLAANWKKMAPQLGLESLCKTTGHLMQTAINGRDGKGTMLIQVLDEYQHQVYAAMTNKESTSIPSYDALKAAVVKCVRLDQSPVSDLTSDQKAVVEPAAQTRTAFLRIFSALDAELSAADAEKVKMVLIGIITDLGRAAVTELEVGIVDDSLSGTRHPQISYRATREIGLNAEEQKTFADFMKKTHFTRADFPALDKFYKGPYDKLSERGKDEMSLRIHAGMKPDN